FTAPTPLGGARPASDPAPSFRERELRLSGTETEALYATANEQRITLNTLVQGAWSLLLSRYGGETDIVFGATRACRGSALGGEGTDTMVGVFINTVPVRVPVDPDRTVRSFLADLRARWRALRDHEHSSLVRIRSWSELPPGAPLFESLLVFEEYLLDTSLRSQGGAWQNRSFRLLEQTGFPLTLAGYGGSELLLKIEYDERRFDDAFIERMLGHLRALLAGLAASPDLPIGDLPMLAPEERRRILVEWNDTGAYLERDRCIHHLIEAQAARTPDAIALSRNGATLSYGELEARANRLASYLRDKGVREESLVAICCERSIEMVVGIVAVLKAGAAYVPLDPSYPPARIDAVVADAQPRVVLSQSSVAALVPTHGAELVLLDADAPAIDLASTARPRTSVKPGQLAYVIYTSGSTGKPKGVAIEHHSAVAMIAWSRTVFSEAELRGVLFSTSICFDLSVFEMFVTLASGGTLVIADNALELPSLVERDRVTLVNTVPTAINELSLANAIPASVVTVNLAGEPLTLALSQQVYRSQASVRRVLNLYGPTEDTTYSTWTEIENGQTTPVTIGRAMTNSQAYVLDARRQPVPIGIPGELYLGGEGVARGYLNRPDLTAERFVENPFAEETGHVEGAGARLYRTGDLVRWLPDGQLEYLGRIDHQVKVRGFRIELGEIESVLCTHPAVKESVVVAREDGNGPKRLVAYVVPRAETSAHDLHAHVKARLPDFMVPSAFVVMTELPLTPNGKVDRKALPAPAAAQASPTREAPRGAAEEAVVELFGAVLDVAPQTIGADDSFFELGGHSLLAVRLMSRIERAFGRRIPLPAFLAAPTARATASLLGRERIGGEIIRVNSPNPARYPLFWCGQSFPQVRLFAERAGADQPVYALESTFYNIKDPRTHVHEVAKRYVDRILEVEPHGPYLLGGFCIDGLVAFEIAHLLRERGHDVPLVAIVERDGPDATYKRLRALSSLFHYHKHELRKLEPLDRARYIAERLTRLPRSFLTLRRREQGHAPDAAEVATLSEEELNSRKAFASRNAYRPRAPYAGRVDLFFTEGTWAELPRLGFRACGWDKAVTGPKHLHVVPGDHDSVGHEPHLAMLAVAVRQSLDAVHAERPKR
ncbi:MAG: amino acid adenylation domain-containing protein, partial [Polyangiaceae bacterium]|nr:amino acid adenylation domain-containing protein [Polyangiaceae bacterium]